MWVLQHHPVHALGMSSIIVVVYLGLQVKWNQFGSNNSHHTSCIHKGLHAGKWPDLMTSKPDSVSTREYHWTNHTGRPLGPQVHWDATGTTLADASAQWCSSGDPVLICIIGTHWNTTERPLEVHWKHTGYQQFFLEWHSSVHWGLKLHAHWIATRLLLNYHWFRVRVYNYHQYILSQHAVMYSCCLWKTKRIMNVIKSLPNLSCRFGRQMGSHFSY